ncbi:RNA 3'-terminal phosphate cyclase [Scomber japonicus]|uniref:RNA 3'-terminal phosphate cyclase n=1 Tax=Scomber japonicus TaxID=13676 RepID=UPI0023057507|nr:RNA 3'-terminal phosphate cyclase [Scomber japonicus]
MESADLQQLDGSVMEGGGQILRVSAALSCITGTAVKITKIRAGRSTPGLRPQHLSGLQLVSDLCSGSLQGAALGSTDISLTPGKIHSGNHTADTETAGSVCLLLQVSLPCALFADASSQFCLKGGTNAEMAPQIDYTIKVFKPILEKFGVHFDCDLKMRCLIIFMALAKGTSRIRTGPVTLHTQTAIHMAEQLTQAKFTITKCEDELSSNDTYVIECEGSGASNPNL